jgi:RNA polymerase sigma-70 factor (ECF subfamily)
MTHDRDGAWDLTQEVFLRVYRKAELYNAEYPLTPWIYRIATRVVLNYLERNRRRRREIAANACNLPEAASPRPGAAAGFEREELERTVQQGLSRLPDNDAMILRLRYIGDLTLGDVAAVLGITVQATKTRLFRARNRLKAILEGPQDD